MHGQVSAYPTVGVVWYRDGVKFTKSDFPNRLLLLYYILQIRLRPSRRTIMTLSHDGHVELTVARVTRRDAGLYACVATNEVGRAESVAKVKIDLSLDTMEVGEEVIEEKKDIVVQIPKDLP